MAINVNQIGYESRLAAIRQICHSRGLQILELSTLAFDEDYEYPFNNFLFRVTLTAPASSTVFPGTQPGTTAAPSRGVSTLVIKLSNPAAGLNSANRVENDVATQYLVRKSMAKAGLGLLVPAIYAWAPCPATEVAKGKDMDFGWMITEFKSGIELNSVFPSLGPEDRKQVLEQIARILRAIQAVEIPKSVEKFGGLTFDLDGRLISGEATLEKGGPAGSYAEWRTRKLHQSLESASRNPILQGWGRRGLNARVERFLYEGGPEKILTEVDQKSIIHGDFTTNNLLFDKDTKTIIALLDFDWSFVSHPFEEFLLSFSDIGGSTGDEDIDKTILRANFGIPPEMLDEEFSKRQKATEIWDEAMSKSGAISPRNMKDAEQIRDILRFQMLLCPVQLRDVCQLEQMNDGEVEDLLVKAEEDLSLWLEKHGF